MFRKESKTMISDGVKKQLYENKCNSKKKERRLYQRGYAKHAYLMSL